MRYENGCVYGIARYWVLLSRIRIVNFGVFI